MNEYATDSSTLEHTQDTKQNNFTINVCNTFEAQGAGGDSTPFQTQSWKKQFFVNPNFLGIQILQEKINYKNFQSGQN